MDTVLLSFFELPAQSKLANGSTDYLATLQWEASVMVCLCTLHSSHSGRQYCVCCRVRCGMPPCCLACCISSVDFGVANLACEIHGTVLGETVAVFE